MPLKYAHILAAVAATEWAIDPNEGEKLFAFLKFKIDGGDYTPDEIRARIQGADQDAPRSRRDGAVAVLRLSGVLSPRAEALEEISGGTSAEGFRKRFNQAVSDSNVSSIILDVNSPGGNVQGIPETFADVVAARGKKPIVAVANHTAASAAFWIASAADEIVVTPSSSVGSIGVITCHEDLSEQMAAAGIKPTLITAGRFKGEGHAAGALSDEAREHIQGRVDEVFATMTKDIAKGRGVSVKDVRNGFGEGRTVFAKEAVEQGMADRIGTLEAEIRRLATRPTTQSRRRRLAVT